MSYSEFFHLVLNAMPDNFGWEAFVSYCPDKWRATMPRIAVVWALRHHPRLDWDAYLEKYPDVGRSGIDPCLHFIRHGIFEARKLVAHDYLRSLSNGRPLVSVIIANYNNELYLEKALDSVASQTLDDIEIIVVDDASTDASIAIIQRFADVDQRFRIIRHKENQSQHMARKHGVEASIGKYIMFLDSDDYYAPDACEKAYAAISGKHDIVCFNSNIIFDRSVDERFARGLENWLNSLDHGVYKTASILRTAFEEAKPNFNMWSKIIEGQLCREVFAIIEDGYHIRDEDAYAFLVLLSEANDFAKINNYLYYYRVRQQSPSLEAKFPDGAYKYSPASILAPIKRYCQDHDMFQAYAMIKHHILSWNVRLEFPNLNNSRFTSYIKALLENSNPLDLIGIFTSIESNALNNIVKAFSCQGIEFSKSYDKKEISVIGIYYHRISIGGVERVITLLSRQLLKRGYRVIVILEESSPSDMQLHDNVEVCYIQRAYGEADTQIAHASSFEHVLKKYDIDLIIYNYGGDPIFRLDALLFKLMNLKFIVINHEDFSKRFIFPLSVYSLYDEINLFKIANRVLCLSTYSELFYRSYGVDCEYLPNPVEITALSKCPNSASQYVQKNILVMARLSDRLKLIGNTLLVLKNVAAKIPDIKLYLAGAFYNDEHRKMLYAYAERLGIIDNIVFVGWTHDTASLFNKCSLLLSTSWWESFGLSIAEAQANGLPCVVYDIPVMQLVDNESIIVVERGDFNGAAAAIVEILNDPELWRKLSGIARKKAARFASEIYGERLAGIINTLDKYCAWHPYSQEEYVKVFQHIAFYASTSRPPSYEEQMRLD